MAMGMVDMGGVIGTNAALVSGRLDVNVATITNNAITAAAIGADAIGASELATDAITEIRTGLGLASANLDTQLAKLDVIDDFLDTEIAAIKAKTDQLDFNSGAVDANILQVNDNATAAANMSTAAQAMLTGALVGTPSTTVLETNLTETNDDQFIGRVLFMTSGTCIRQAVEITDYDGATKTLTVAPLTDAPSAGNTFIIV